MDISHTFMKRGREIKAKSTKRFDAWSGKYDKSVLQTLVFRNSHDMFLSRIKEAKRVFRILDIGCGTGEFAIKLKQANRNAEIYGLDISQEMINQARKKTGMSGGVDFKVGDVEHLPYENGHFDYITCAHSFHHYPNKRKAIREMYRVLKDNGKAMIIDGCKDGLLGRVIFDVIIKRHEIDVHHLHSKQFQKIMKKVGFENIRQTVFNPFIPLLLTQGTARKRKTQN